MIKYPLDNLIPEIISDDNLYTAIDYVIDHLECPYQRDRFRPVKTLDSTPEIEVRWQKYYRWRDRVASLLRQEIKTGEFKITRADVQEIHVNECHKERDCQAPLIIKRIGISAVTVVVEKHTKGDLIHNTAAGIKDRGIHWLHHIIEDDIRNVPDMCQYYFQCDIEKYYDSIPQDKMYECIKTYISDPILLKILYSFITLMPQGLSKGLRSSQCFANLYLNNVHKRMQKECGRYFLIHKDGTIEVRYLYYSYCDDTDFFAPTKKEAWRLSKIYSEEVEKLGLKVKGNYAVRPLSEGLDCLGYVHYPQTDEHPSYSLLRKRVKQNAARKLSKVKSRKRRQEIIGSFKGMACHADCKNLFFKLTHHRMKKFSEMGVTYTPADGKKRFPGKVLPLRTLQNKVIEVHDYESDLTTSHGEGRYLVSFRDATSKEWGKFFTSSEEMKNILDQISDIEEGFPFETTITSEVFDGNKVKYKFT